MLINTNKLIVVYEIYFSFVVFIKPGLIFYDCYFSVLRCTYFNVHVKNFNTSKRTEHFRILFQQLTKVLFKLNLYELRTFVYQFKDSV